MLQVSSLELTACYLHWTSLPVQWVQFQVHWAGQSEGDSDAEEHHAVREYSDIQIGNKNIVHPAAPLIPEECVWHPHFPRVCDGQVLDLV